MYLGQLSGCLISLLLALNRAIVRIKYHPYYGNQNTQNIAPTKRVVKQNVAKSQNQTSLQMSKDLIRYRRRFSDYQKCAKIYRNRYQAGENNEELQ